MIVSVLFTIFMILWAFGAVSTLLREDMLTWVASDFALCLFMALLFMTIIFLIALRIRRYDLVDAAWGLTFIVVALTSFLLQDGPLFELDAALLVTLLVIVWGTRLSWHIIKRIKHTDREDPRYVELRKKWRGNLKVNVYTRIFLLQAVLATLISVPVIHVNLFATPELATANLANVLFWTIGLLVWTKGFYFEKTADDQLRAFVNDPKNKGKLMTSGLWKYSRHPNYFGELTQWWGIFLICLSTPFGWVGVVGPVLISYLILFVSGIPLSEKRFEGRPGWAEYRDRTSVLIPLPFKR